MKGARLTEAYTKNGRPTTFNREERERLSGMLRGKKAMAGLDLLAVKNAIARSPREKPDAAGRYRRIGNNAAALAVDLLFWEGSGEAEDYSIHRTRRGVFESPAALTESMQKTARRILAEEGLLEHWTGYRPSDRRPTTYYRLNLWEVARVVNRSELDNVTNQLDRRMPKKRRDELNKKRRDLEAARDDLNLFGKQDSASPEPELEPGQLSRQTRPTSVAYRREPQESTSVSTGVDTPVRAEGTQAGGDHAQDLQPPEGQRIPARQRGVPLQPRSCEELARR